MAENRQDELAAALAESPLLKGAIKASLAEAFGYTEKAVEAWLEYADELASGGYTREAEAVRRHVEALRSDI